MKYLLIILSLVSGICWADISESYIEIPRALIPRVYDTWKMMSLEEGYYYLNKLREGKDININGLEIKSDGTGDIKFNRRLLKESNSHFETIFKMKKQNGFAYGYSYDIKELVWHLLIYGEVEIHYVKIRIK